MDPLQLRENEIFDTLKAIKKFKFVIIGGYAVNAYALPRFSVDCDIVVNDKIEARAIEKVLLKIGYERIEPKEANALASFAKYEKTISEFFNVSFDLLIGEVMDRQTKVSISADWIFKNSRIRPLKGKTIKEKLQARIINVDALFVMKMISCRSTDIRDIFMMALTIKDKKWIKTEVSLRYDFSNRFNKVIETITSRKFRDGLQGVYGLIDGQTFKRSLHVMTLLNIED